MTQACVNSTEVETKKTEGTFSCSRTSDGNAEKLFRGQIVLTQPSTQRRIGFQRPDCANNSKQKSESELSHMHARTHALCAWIAVVSGGRNRLQWKLGRGGNLQNVKRSLSAERRCRPMFGGDA